MDLIKFKGSCLLYYIMTKFWKNISTSIFFLISSTFLIISEFTPWINQTYSPWYFFQNVDSASIIYIFPLISSFIVIILGIILIFNKFIKMNKVLISIIGFLAQSLNTLFLIVIFTEGIEINTYNYGVFLGISGFALLFWALFWILIQDSQDVKQEK